MPKLIRKLNNMKKLFLSLFAVYLSSCVPIPISGVSMESSTDLGFESETVVKKKEVTYSSNNSPYVFFQPEIRRINYSNYKVNSSLPLVNNDEIYVGINASSIDSSCYEGIFPMFMPLFPYMSCPHGEERWDKNVVFKVYRKIKQPLHQQYYFSDMYIDVDGKKVYPLSPFQLTVSRKEKNNEIVENVEFPLSYSDIEGKVLHIETIRSDKQNYTPISRTLQIYKMYCKSWTFFGGFICLNCG